MVNCVQVLIACRHMGEEHCAPESRNVTSTLPPFFDWAKYATYEGQPKVREMNYDLWGLTVSDCPNCGVYKHLC